MKIDTDEKELLASVERASGNPLAVAGANERAMLATARPACSTSMRRAASKRPEEQRLRFSEHIQLSRPPNRPMFCRQAPGARLPAARRRRLAQHDV